MQKKTLLVVDDERGILRALRRVFRKADYDLLLAENGAEALELLANNEVQVILSDFRMPGMDGGQLLETAMRHYPETVGMILSGFAELRAIMDTFDKGVVYKFITKPWDDVTLLAEVDRAFEIAARKSVELDLASVFPLSSEDTDNPHCARSARLLNRVAFSRHISQQLSNESTPPGTLFLIDVTGGRAHLAELGLVNTAELLRFYGDQLLRALSGQHWVSHWGAARFLIWSEHSSREQIDQVIRQLSEFTHWSSSGTALLRVGIVCAEPNNRLDQLILAAQTARYRASQIDPFQIYQGPESDDLNNPVEIRLGQALAEGALQTHLQPILSSRGDRLIAIEALTRWQDAELGQVDPMEIVVAADSLGFTEQFTQWMFTSACSNYAQILEVTGAELKLCLNLSLWQLENASFISALDSALAATGISYPQLIFDISENVIVNAQASCIENLAHLRARGAGLVLDDFGTAYSVLRSGLDLPVSAVKIDGSFLRFVLSQANQQEVLLHITEVIEARGLALAFEGVETEEQFNFLKQRLEFDYQGYLIAPAMPVPQFIDWFRARFCN